MSIGSADFTNVIFIAAAAIGALLAAGIGYYVVRRIRKWMHTDEQAKTFSLHDLRQMRESGQLSEREYEQLRRSTIANVMTPSAGDDPKARKKSADGANGGGSTDFHHRDELDGGEGGGDGGGGNGGD